MRPCSTKCCTNAADEHLPANDFGFPRSFVSGSNRETLPLAPQDENSLKGDAKSPIAAGATIILTIKTAEGKSGQAKSRSRRSIWSGGNGSGRMWIGYRTFCQGCCRPDHSR